MAAAEVTLSGVLYNKLTRTTDQVVFIGDAMLTGLGVGGGPIVPPPGQPTDPVHIWGGGNVPMPSPPIANVPGAPGYPITPIPPNTPNVPPPGSPPVIVSGTTPVHPITPPPAIIVDYPGIGKVVVPQPTQTQPAPVKK